LINFVKIQTYMRIEKYVIETIYQEPCITFSHFLTQQIKLIDIYRKKTKKLKIEIVCKQLKTS